MSEYDDREKWSDKGLLEIFKKPVCDICFPSEDILAAILKRMSAAPQDDEWEERELHNEIMQEGDIFRYTGDDEPLLPLWFGKNSNELYFAKIIRRVSKKKPHSDKEQPEAPQVKFAIAGTKDADLPGVVVLELKESATDVSLNCKSYYLLSIDKYTGQVSRVPCVGNDTGLPLDDQGRLVIE